MIVDDDQSLRYLLERILHDYEVVGAANGAEAIEILGVLNFHAIVFDLQMPVMDGPTFHEEVMWKFPEYSGRLAAMTGCQENYEDFCSRGLVPVVDKPFLRHEMRELVNELCHGRG